MFSKIFVCFDHSVLARKKERSPFALSNCTAAVLGFLLSRTGQEIKDRTLSHDLCEYLHRCYHCCCCSEQRLYVSFADCSFTCISSLDVSPGVAVNGVTVTAWRPLHYHSLMAPQGQITPAAAGDNHTCLPDPFFEFFSRHVYLHVVLALRHPKPLRCQFLCRIVLLFEKKSIHCKMALCNNRKNCISLQRFACLKLQSPTVPPLSRPDRSSVADVTYILIDWKIVSLGKVTETESPSSAARTNLSIAFAQLIIISRQIGVAVSV